jgi:hypothetical protein
MNTPIDELFDMYKLNDEIAVIPARTSDTTFVCKIIYFTDNRYGITNVHMKNCLTQDEAAAQARLYFENFM